MRSELALLYVDAGRAGEGQAHADRAVELAGQADSDTMAAALTARGTAYGSVADLAAALKLATGTGNTYLQALALIAQAGAYRQTGDDRQAQACATTAREFAATAGLRHLERLASAALCSTI